MGRYENGERYIYRDLRQPYMDTSKKYFKFNWEENCIFLVWMKFSRTVVNNFGYLEIIDETLFLK